jgi:hypothetical protein
MWYRSTWNWPSKGHLVNSISVCRLTDATPYHAGIVKVQGEFTWHKHADTDEFFLVLSGQLAIQMRDRNAELAPRELSSCQASSRSTGTNAAVEHCPRADTENRDPAA